MTRGALLQKCVAIFQMKFTPRDDDIVADVPKGLEQMAEEEKTAVFHLKNHPNGGFESRCKICTPAALIRLATLLGLGFLIAISLFGGNGGVELIRVLNLIKERAGNFTAAASMND